jgi:hypothetical protein
MRIVKLYENGENECEPSRLKGTAGIKIQVMCLISPYHQHLLCFFTSISISRVSLSSSSLINRCYFASLHPSPFFFILSAFHQHRPNTNRPPFLFYATALPFAPPSNLRCLSSPLLNRRRFQVRGILKWEGERIKSQPLD